MVPHTRAFVPQKRTVPKKKKDMDHDYNCQHPKDHEHMWGDRNKTLHNKDTKEYVSKKDEKLNKIIQKEFKRGIKGIHPNEFEFLSLPRKIL